MKDSANKSLLLLLKKEFLWEQFIARDLKFRKHGLCK